MSYFDLLVVAPVEGAIEVVKPLVSVIIPTHNRAKLLDEALASVYAQEAAGEQFEMEVIVVDDASSDATPEVVRRYPGVRYFRLAKNGGVSAARKAGIKASNGNYLGFLDDDDLWLPHRLKVQVPVLEAHPEVGAVYGQSLLRGEGYDNPWPDAGRAPSGKVFEAFLMEDFIAIGSLLVRREAFEMAGYPDESLRTMEHYDMCLRLAFHVPFEFMPGPVYIHRFSKRGKWFTNLVGGGVEKILPFIVERALNMLPDAGDYSTVRRNTYNSVYLRIVDCLMVLGEVDPFRAHARALTQIYNKERSVVRNTRKLAHEIADASMSTGVRAFRREIRTAAATCGLTRIEVRQLLADALAEAAIGFGNRNSPRAAAYLAIYAIIYHPALLRRKIVWKLLTRGILASLRWDSIPRTLKKLAQ